MAFNNKSSDLSLPKGGGGQVLSYNQKLMKARGYSDAEIHSNSARAHHYHTGGDAHHHSSSVGGAACFAWWSEVRCENAWVPIYRIQPGDRVACVAGDGGIVTATVRRCTMSRQKKEILWMRLKNGICSFPTPSETLLTDDGWKRASRIASEASLAYLDDGLAFEAIDAMGTTRTHETAYNLIVDWHLNFIVRGAIGHSFSYARGLRVFLHRVAYRLRRRTFALERRIAKPVG